MLRSVFCLFAGLLWAGSHWAGSLWAQGTDAPDAPAAATAPLEWQYPLDVTIAGDGSFILADRKLPGLWHHAAGTNRVLYQGKKMFRTPLNAVRCVQFGDDGVLYAGDSSTREVYAISLTDKDAEPKGLSNRSIGIPSAMAIVGGTIYVTDLELQRVWKLPAQGLEPGKSPAEFAQVAGARGIFIDDKGLIWVLSSLKPQLRKYKGDGTFDAVVDDLVFEFPHQVVVNKDGTAFVTDGYAKAIWKIPPGGKPEKWVSGEPFVNPVGLRQHGTDLIVCDSRANALFRVTPEGQVTKIHSGPPNPLVPADAVGIKGQDPVAPAKPAEPPK